MKRTAFCGVEGAYAHIAAQIMLPDTEKTAFPSFEQAYRSVERGECDGAVLPVENNCAGEVGEVLDLIFTGGLYVTAMREMPICHSLLAMRSAQEKYIKTVVSHPQALEQCARFIAERGWETREFSNTAAAAKFVRDSAEPTLAAVASKETARLFGLDVLRENINDISDNATRFALLSGSRAYGKNGFILVFTIENKAGALAEALNVIGSCGFDMNCIHSRPMKTLTWEYYFYVEARGDISSQRGEDMLCVLSESCKSLRVAGTY